MTAAEIIAAARQCVGTPFRHQGRSIETGLDCAGVCVYVAFAIGLRPVDPVGYGRTPANGQLENTLDMQEFLVRLPNVDQRQPGDILLMRFLDDPQHIAVFCGPTIVHAYESVGKCCEHIIDDKWARRIVRVYRFAGVTE